VCVCIYIYIYICVCVCNIWVCSGDLIYIILDGQHINIFYRINKIILKTMQQREHHVVEVNGSTLTGCPSPRGWCSIHPELVVVVHPPRGGGVASTQRVVVVVHPPRGGGVASTQRVVVVVVV